jgi:hypothetical protein
MLKRPMGTVLLAAASLAGGLAGILAFWAAWPRNPNTSPLAALFALVWSCTYIVTGVLAWRRSRFAGAAFLAAIGLLLFPARLLFPGGQLFLPALVAILPLAFLGYRYLHNTCRGRAGAPL